MQPAVEQQSPSDPFELLSQPNDNASVHASTTSAVSGDDLADPFSMLAMRHNPHGSGGSSSQQSSAAQIGASGGFDLLGDAPIQPTPAHPQGEQKAAGKPSASVYDHIDELFAVSSAPPTQANTQYFLPRYVGVADGARFCVSPLVKLLLTMMYRMLLLALLANARSQRFRHINSFLLSSSNHSISRYPF